MKNCPSKKSIIISIIAVFVFTYLYDYLVHGMLMTPLYAQFTHLWRPMAEMQEMMVYCLIYHIINAVIAVSLFGCYLSYAKTACEVEPPVNGKKPCPHSKAICFGFTVGLLLGINHATAYISMPISVGLALAWLIADVAKFVGIGVVMSLTMCNKGEVK